MAHIENQLLCNDLESSPKLYLRYTDGIFAIFEDSQSYLKNCFYSNGYPIPFFNKILYQFQNEKQTIKSEKNLLILFSFPISKKSQKKSLSNSITNKETV